MAAITLIARNMRENITLNVFYASVQNLSIAISRWWRHIGSHCTAVLCPLLYLYGEQRMETGHIAFVLLEVLSYQIYPQFSRNAGEK